MDHAMHHLEGAPDTETIRAAARKPGGAYAGNRAGSIDVLSSAPAAELVCIMRCKRHDYAIGGPNKTANKPGLIEHANEGARAEDLRDPMQAH